MIDLSFLTEEEQETVLAVLKRDAELKKAEEQRVKNLQKTVSDKDRLKYLTGEWFYETKQLRHQDRIHGSDIIRASMKHKHIPLTILELSQIAPEKKSLVNSENKEVFVPAVLRGILQEPHTQLCNDMYLNQDPFETPRDDPKLDVLSPTKQRKNPFNSEGIASHTFEEKDEAGDQTQILNETPLPSSDSCISYACNLTQDVYDSNVTQNASVPMSVPENTVVSTSSQDGLVEADGPGGSQTDCVSLRGILKQLSTCSSTDSLVDSQTPVPHDSPNDTWIDRKQVRFSFGCGKEWQDGKELGEHGLLDVDIIAVSKAESNSTLKTAGSTTVGTHSPPLNQNQEDSEGSEPGCKTVADRDEQEAGQHQVLGDVSEHCPSEFLGPAVSGLVCDEQGADKPVHQEKEPEEDHPFQIEAENVPAEHKHSTDMYVQASPDTIASIVSSKDSSHAISPKPRQRLPELFRREIDGIGELKSPQKEQVNRVKQEVSGNTQNLSQESADMMVDRSTSGKQEAKLSELKEVRTLHLTALQNTPFKEPMTSGSADSQLPERLPLEGNLKASSERENSNSKIIFTRVETRHKDITKTRAGASHGPLAHSGEMENINNSPSPQMERVTDTAVTPQEKYLLPKTDCSPLLDLSKEDGTYRANPVLIYEDSDDSFSDTKPQPSEPKEIVLTPGAFDIQKQGRDIPVPLPRQTSSSPLEERPVNISNLKHFWEKTGPKVTIKDASISSVISKKVKSPDPRTYLDSTEESEGEAHMSPCKPKFDVSKSLKLKNKGFVIQDPNRAHRKSCDYIENVQSTSQQFESQSDMMSQHQPLVCPDRSQSPRSKDQDDEVRRSPSKTIHPRVLPIESSSPTRSRLEGSPLKTFPIDIAPKTKVMEELQVKPTPVPRQRKSPSHEAKQSVLTETKHSTDIPSSPHPLHPEDRGTYFDNLNTQQSSASSSSSLQSKKAPQMKSGTFTRLAISFIPQEYQHYLRPEEKSHVPLFHPEGAASAEGAAAHTPQNTPREYVGHQNHSPTEESPTRVTKKELETRAWSLPRASAGSYNDTSSPIMSALKRLSSRNKSSSKSVENLSSATNSSLLPSSCTSSNSQQMKSSGSVPALKQDETDSDGPFESSLGWRRNTGSSTSNMSLSSGMASMSSVSGSMSSIYHGDFGDIEVQGSIQFAMNYIQKLGEFHIFVVHCKDLAIADAKKNRSDPYVKCYLLPDETKLGKRKSAVKKKTLNPNYNEILRFKVVMEVLKTRTLNISLWHNDTFGRNSFLGQVDLDLSQWDFSNTQINEYALKARVSAQSPAFPASSVIDSRGQMRVALRFLPQTSHSKRASRMETGEVQIWVKDCKNLPPVRGAVMDPFVKCTVLPDTSRKSRQKTRVVKRTANPLFNHTMVYDGFRPEDLREACVEVTVWDHDRLNNHYIGGLRLGLGTGKSYGVEVVWMDSTTEEANLWQRMLHSDGEWVEDILALRMFVMAKSTSK